jgi:biotin synthase-like enzyme
LLKKADVTKVKPVPNQKLRETVRKVALIRRMFPMRSKEKLMAAFEAEWIRPELQNFLESSNLSKEEICQMKDVVRENYAHTTVAFKAVCANVGETR